MIKQRARSQAKKIVNSALSRVDLEIVPRGRGIFENYIPLKATLTAARAASLPLGDYIDTRYNVPGSTQQTLDCMAELGVFREPIERVVEIGPGSGRYLHKTLAACHPSAYEIYETAKDWRDWMAQEYGVIAHPANGFSLAQTASNTVDLVQAHKVMPGLPILTVCNYFTEMVRVLRPGGWLVFDVLTERCLSDESLPNWFAARPTWPRTLVPRDYAVRFFVRRGLAFVGSFTITLVPGITEYLVFQRMA